MMFISKAFITAEKFHYDEEELRGFTRSSCAKSKLKIHSKRDSDFSENDENIHRLALAAVTAFKISESALVEALIAVESAKLYLRMGYSSLYQYAFQDLQLSESVAYTAVSVARKARDIPALREAVTAGELGLSKARKVLSVLDRSSSAETQKAWVQRAVVLSTSELKKR